MARSSLLKCALFPTPWTILMIAVSVSLLLSGDEDQVDGRRIPKSSRSSRSGRKAARAMTSSATSSSHGGVPKQQRRNDYVRMDPVKNLILDVPQLNWLLKPMQRAAQDGGASLDGFVSTGGGLAMPGGTGGFTRKLRLWCRSGIGYHMEINARGKVVARHEKSKNGILEMVSVSRGIVGIRSSSHQKRYICMNKRGKLVTRTMFQPECAFREKREDNKFDTYASEVYSDHKRREGYFLGIRPNGKMQRAKKVSWWQKRAQWLPRPP